MKDLLRVRHGVAAALLVIPALCPMACKKSSREVTTHWLSSKVEIDGKFTDWDAVPTSVMHEDHAVLKLANDSQFLYLYYITDDVDWVRTIRMTGLTLYFNRDGSRDQAFFVRYRNGPALQDSLARQAGPGSAPPDLLHPAMREQMLESERESRPEFTCFVRDWIVEKSIPTDGRQGPGAAYGPLGGSFAYEFRIPLRRSEALYYGLGASPGDKIGIGAAWGDMPRPAMDAEPPGGEDFGGSRSQGSSLGEFGDPAQSGPGGGAPPDLPEKEEVWITTRLSQGAVATP